MLRAQTLMGYSLAGPMCTQPAYADTATEWHCGQGAGDSDWVNRNRGH